jgi:catechol 2,3-dioxygenase-like lactoylglutathione lyase family enzyme
MTTTKDAKMMARRLHSAMEGRGLAATHSDTLELIAAQLGYRDWNTASAALATTETAGPVFTHSIPVLRSLDEDKCRAFYCEYLGFAVDFEHRFEPHMPLYLGLKRGPVLLHLTEHRGDAATGSATFVWMLRIDDYRDELLGRGKGFPAPKVIDQPWGREITLLDPFGNRLRFCERPD